MKHVILIILLTTCVMSQSGKNGFVEIQKEIRSIIVDLRYFSEDNFVGQRVDGYQSNKLYISIEAATALKKVQNELNRYGLGLKIFDGYRPQSAVDHFVRWAKDIKNTKTKEKYYPNELKKNLFKKGYIATKSGHTRGSTLDLTIVQLDIHGNEITELDMGTPWDFFSEKSATEYKHLTIAQRSNRLLLKSVMEKFGFKNYDKEWWHYTLINEPYKNTYFDFIIK